MPGIETLWIMTQDERLKPYTDFEEGEGGGDSLCVSYFYGGPERREAFIKYGSHDTNEMTRSVHTCLSNIHNNVRMDGNTIAMPYVDEGDWGDWGPVAIAKGLLTGGWECELTRDGDQFIMQIGTYRGKPQLPYSRWIHGNGNDGQPLSL